MKRQQRSPDWLTIGTVGAVVITWLGMPLYGAHLMAPDRHSMPIGVGNAATDPHTAAVGGGLMLVAMMLPLLLSPLRHVYEQNVAERRWQSIALFLCGYFALWMLLGLLSLLPHQKPQLQSLLAHTILAVTAIVWQFSPAKQFCLNRCHRYPSLRAFGLRANVEALTFGSRHGMWCAASCLLPMALVMAIPLYGVTMPLVAFWLLAERLEQSRKPRWELRFPKRLFLATHSSVTRLLYFHKTNLSDPIVSEPHML